MKIGILTGGGDAPGLNAVIRAVVRAAANQYDMNVIGIADGFKGLVERNFIPLDPHAVSGILPRGGTILGTTNRDNPFHYRRRGDDGKKFFDASDIALNNAAEEGIEGIIAIGGDGSLAIARDFLAKGLPFVGIPKTIDNDLDATELTFGFQSAVQVATEALDRLHTTAESHHRVMILELMGRYTGWIALEAGLAGGADVILIPEIPFTIDSISRTIRHRLAAGKNFSLIVAAEGAKEHGGEIIVRKTVAGSPDPIRLGGIGAFLAQRIEREMNLETRATVLGHLQRGGSPTAFDRNLATRYGVAAVDLVAAGDWGKVTVLQQGEIRAVPIADAVERLKKVPVDGEMVRTARILGVGLGD